ncbi:MAG: ribosome-associated translation inhibitor RaiA [Alphaproteobacteria bacterium]|nr:ribosome-associated translation inhibitor RaiA [Alphaproteobacteria bacterium]
MQIQITGKNIDVGDALRSHIEDRLEGDVAKYFDGIVDGHVTVLKENSEFRCECNLHLRTGMSLQTEGRSNDAHAAFDKAAERLEKRLRRYKRRLKDHHVRTSAKEVAALNAAAYIIAQEAETADEPDDLSPPIIAESVERIPDLTVGEAVMKLDISDAPVVVFRNAGHRGLNVIYRRSDGNIGWIDPGSSNPADSI